MENKKNRNIGIRLASMLLDHFIMTFGIVIIAFILVGIGYLIVGNPSESDLPEWLIIIPIFFGLLQRKAGAAVIKTQKSLAPKNQSIIS
mgnify:CR=1 FL=1